MIQHQYAIILILLAATLFLSSVSKKTSIPYPVFLVIAWVLIGFIPSMDVITLDPSIVFLLFLPPLLYDAAANTNLWLFKRHIGTISTLALSLVFISTAGIATIAHYLIPGMSWQTWFLLWAILSATDAVAAINITKWLNLSDKTITILEGESLINDASALTAYHFAIAAVGGATFVFREAGIEFLGLIIGGAAIWLIIGKLLRIMLRMTKENQTISVGFTLLTPFITYLVAELFHTSWVIAVVVLGIFVTKFTNASFPLATKTLSKNIRDMFTFLINGFIFLIIWLNFNIILQNIPTTHIPTLIGSGFIIAIGAFLIRMGIVYIEAWIRRRKYILKPSKERAKQRLSRQSALVISWSGMRWIVSLATALAIPLYLADGSLFPERDKILFLSIVVVLITLVVQWIGLPYLVNYLHITSKQQE